MMKAQHLKNFIYGKIGEININANEYSVLQITQKLIDILKPGSKED